MPISIRYHDKEVQEYIFDRFHCDSWILDIGTGAGLNWDMLHRYYENIDGIEIWEPYVEQYELEDKYTNLYVEDVMDCLHLFEDYDLVLMGDVMEHLKIKDCWKILKQLEADQVPAIVQVPYQCPQGIYEGNIHEVHIQDDLTKEIMEKRYGQYLEFKGLKGNIAWYVSKW